MELALISFLFVLWMFSLLVSFYLGGLSKDTKRAAQASQLAFGAAFWAVTEAKALKNATVIRSIVEKYNFLEKKDSDELSKQAKEMEREFEETINNVHSTRKPKKSDDIFNDFDDLV